MPKIRLRNGQDETGRATTLSNTHMRSPKGYIRTSIGGPEVRACEDSVGHLGPPRQDMSKQAAQIVKLSEGFARPPWSKAAVVPYNGLADRCPQEENAGMAAVSRRESC